MSRTGVGRRQVSVFFWAGAVLASLSAGTVGAQTVPPTISISSPVPGQPISLATSPFIRVSYTIDPSVGFDSTQNPTVLVNAIDWSSRFLPGETSAAYPLIPSDLAKLVGGTQKLTIDASITDASGAS